MLHIVGEGLCDNSWILLSPQVLPYMVAPFWWPYIENIFVQNCLYEVKPENVKGQYRFDRFHMFWMLFFFLLKEINMEGGRQNNLNSLFDSTGVKSKETEHTNEIMKDKANGKSKWYFLLPFLILSNILVSLA